MTCTRNLGKEPWRRRQSLCLPERRPTPPPETIPPETIRHFLRYDSKLVIRRMPPHQIQKYFSHHRVPHSQIRSIAGKIPPLCYGYTTDIRWVYHEYATDMQWVYHGYAMGVPRLWPQLCRLSGHDILPRQQSKGPVPLTLHLDTPKWPMLTFTVPYPCPATLRRSCFQLDTAPRETCQPYH